MGYIVKMPKLGLEMEMGTVLEWTVDVDERFEEGDVLVEVESEKSIGEVEAREDGALRHVYVEEDEKVPPGTPIGIVAAPDADVSDLRAEAEAELAEKAPEAAPSAAATAETADAAAATSEASGAESEAATAEATASESEADVKASPRARKRAEELGVDLATVEATGPMGSITEEDVEAAAESEPADAGAAGETEEIKASPRARKRAEELGVDLTTVEATGPMGSVTEEDVEAAAAAGAEKAGPPTDTADIGVAALEGDTADRYQRTTAVAAPATAEALFETMEAVRSAFEARVTMTDVLLVVASATLDDHPVVNGTYAESTHQLQETQDVALVADADDESRTRVVSDLRTRSLSDVVDARQAAEPDADAESTPATFTLANAAETDAEGRLVNPPGVAALAVDPTGQRAVPDGDGVDLRPLVTASLTYDTRALGERDAQAFLEGFFDRAEQAPELVLRSYQGQE